MKPRNPTATDPRLQKSHAHKSKKDYNRKEEKKKLEEELSKGENRKK
jgi:hypothetical protein